MNCEAGPTKTIRWTIVDDNLLFVRDDPSGQQPARLLLLDTPDIDGTLKQNWRRADLVRYAADVLVCILTQQKYNDAAIREFFRAAAEAEKTVIVVFNMVHWPRQQELCRGWLAHFSQETGVQPAAVYAVPWDPDRAEQQTLPFYPLSPGATDLQADLAELQFDAIKIRSLEGSLRRVLDENTGLPAFLRGWIVARKISPAPAICWITTSANNRSSYPTCRGNWCGTKSGTGWKAAARGSIAGFMALTTNWATWSTRWWRDDPEEALEAFRCAEFDRLQVALAAQARSARTAAPRRQFDSHQRIGSACWADWIALNCLTNCNVATGRRRW